MITNIGSMGKIIYCDICGESIRVDAWYDIKKAMEEHGFVKIGSTKKAHCLLQEMSGGW